MTSSSPAKQEMVIRSDLGGAGAEARGSALAGIPADTMSIALVTATQCEGVIVIHEKMFESRLFFVDKLIGMGAKIVPLRSASRRRRRTDASCIPAAWSLPTSAPAMAMLLAALCRRGESIIDNVDRSSAAYERIDERLRALGAKVERVEDRRSK
jgi:UDP-N-acetylglucosamine 1-carboxyvinyltransferase